MNFTSAYLRFLNLLICKDLVSNRTEQFDLTSRTDRKSEFYSLTAVFENRKKRSILATALVFHAVCFKMLDLSKMLSP